MAHALGTLIGAFAAVKIAATKKFVFAMVLGGWFLLGGIAVNFYVAPGPDWFTAVDILLAYFPMAWIGYKLADGKKKPHDLNLPIDLDT